jgi:hypothetical protein
MDEHHSGIHAVHLSRRSVVCHVVGKGGPKLEEKLPTRAHPFGDAGGGFVVNPAGDQ